MNDDSTVRVKVKPYPIAFELTGGPAPIHGKIIRLAPQGIMANMDQAILHVNEKYIIHFELPVMKKKIEAASVVFKVHDHIQDKYDPEQKRNVGHEIVRLTELHFQKITQQQLFWIQKFLTSIGQALKV